MAQSTQLREFTDDAFSQDVLQSDQAVLVDFWAPWCGPCRMVGPVIEEIADEFAGRAVVGKVNVDDNREIATQFQIQAIPSVLVFRGGEVVERIVGAQPKERYQQALEAAL
ncbi:Thioredoxin-1 [Maioricimonas rarisocia]|uniref:Thioredoxin n=1 Tax=Maioricimonas rarisocia TaxID=2528026 RepID=A0A517ZG78_9PLAN|nr:thioredoxin [Maioricimonas rarisocia]QDU41464.1 Thioredoxin-1 [Maioricimonas rarisocia]